MAPPAPPAPLARAAPLLPLALLGLTIPAGWASPQEDAHIMFRYARNLAGGHGLTWNPGEDPVEGATAFLWTVLLAGSERLGSGVTNGAIALSVLALVGAVVVLARLAPRHLEIRPSHGVIAGCLLAVSPLVRHAGTGFSAPLAGLLLLLLTFALARCAWGDPAARSQAAHGVPALGLLLGLLRPEGAAVAVVAIACALALAQRSERARLARRAVAWFVLPGAVYFAWRWTYFGALLPNTFYAKARLFPPDAMRSLALGVRPIVWLGALLLPVLLVAAMGLLRWPARDRLRFALVALPAVVLPFTYAVVVQIQNIGHRYQAPAIPAALLLATIAASGIGTRQAGTPRLRRAQAVLAAVALLWFDGISRSIQIPPTPPDLQIIGESLRPLATHDVRLLSSEAGVLPYVSEWPAVDPFGLYDEHVAHHGMDDAWLDRQHADVIMFHVFSAVWTPTFGGRYAEGRWNEMVQHLYRYARSRPYDLVAIVQRGSDPDNVHWYWVRRDSPDRDAIVQAITGHAELAYR